MKHEILEHALRQGDQIIKLDRPTLLDIKDYLNMLVGDLPTGSRWESLRSLKVTVQGDTLWQISERYNDAVAPEAIGNIGAPTPLLAAILYAQHYYDDFNRLYL